MERAGKSDRTKHTGGKNETVIPVTSLIINEKALAPFVMLDHRRKLFDEVFWTKYLYCCHFAFTWSVCEYEKFEILCQKE